MLPKATSYSGLSSLKLASQKRRDERFPVRAVKGIVFKAKKGQFREERKESKKGKEKGKAVGK